MTEGVFAETMAGPRNPASTRWTRRTSRPLVVWLGSDEARAVTGRVFEVEGGQLSVADGWQHGPVHDKGARWDPAELTPVISQLIAESPVPDPVYGAGWSNSCRPDA